jgi:hypothetical protein
VTTASGQARIGLGRIVASCYGSSALYQIHLRESVPLFMKRQCGRTVGAEPPAELRPAGWPTGLYLAEVLICQVKVIRQAV